jgi:peptidyl-prolyl cis-trans isomerase B (cyclophilin B)
MNSSHKLLLTLTLVPLLALAACGSNGSGGKTSGDVTASSSAKPAASQGKCTYTKDGSKAARPVKLPPANPPKQLPKAMTISTNRGDIKVSLDTAQAPCTVNSFVSLARQGYFDHTRCHRLTTSGIYVLQCGDPTATGTGGPGYTFPDELHSNDPRIQPCQTQGGQEVCTYGPGTLAMANAGPNTNGSQFFIVLDDLAGKLPKNYTIFGKVTDGMDVVDQIASVPRKMGAGGEQSSPTEPVTLEKVTVQAS